MQKDDLFSFTNRTVFSQRLQLILYHFCMKGVLRQNKNRGTEHMANILFYFGRIGEINSHKLNKQTKTFTFQDET